MSSTCCSCSGSGDESSWFSITIAGEDGAERTLVFCPSCAGKYLDSMDMLGMTVGMVKSVETRGAA